MDKKVDEYIQKQKSPQKEICKKIQKLILKTFPKIKEQMKWGVPAYENGKFYFVALKDHVNIGFKIKDLTPEELSLFEAVGKETAHIEIREIKEVSKKGIPKLLKLVNKK